MRLRHVKCASRTCASPRFPEALLVRLSSTPRHTHFKTLPNLYVETWSCWRSPLITVEEQLAQSHQYLLLYFFCPMFSQIAIETIDSSSSAPDDGILKHENC